MLLSESGKSHGTTYPPTSLVTFHLHGFSVSKVFPVCSCVAFFFTTYLPELPNFIPRVHWKCGVSRFHLPEWQGNQKNPCAKEKWSDRDRDEKWSKMMPKWPTQIQSLRAKDTWVHAKKTCETNMFSNAFFNLCSAKHRSCEFSLSSVRCSPDTVKSLQDFVDSVTAFPLPLAFPSRLRLRSIFSSASSSPATWRMGESLTCRVLPTKPARGSTNWCVSKNICLQDDPNTCLKKLCTSICGSICCWSLGIWSCFDIILGINSSNSVHSYPHTTPVHSEAGIAKHMLISYIYFRWYWVDHPRTCTSKCPLIFFWTAAFQPPSYLVYVQS